ncbi:hypothetical protein TNCV_3546951 [Trichonephila clavipes]|nr:hypothetical protein TNCV_3546951 [Trichonephila clavipes]
MQLLPLAAYSPDMSPIEHVWYLVGRRPRHSTSKRRNFAAHAKYVEFSSLADIQNLFDSMPRRIVALVTRVVDDDRFNSCQVIYSQFGLTIHQNDHQAMRRFVEWAQNEIAVVPDFNKRILFSDEAHFWLNSYVNKTKLPHLGEANPQVYVETLLLWYI